MPVYSIIFMVVYIATMISYFFSETSGNFKRRAINKIILATLFWLYALFEMIHLHKGDDLQALLMLGITFSYIGDVWLLWSFTKGGIAFMIGNVIISICLFKYAGVLGFAFASYWWFLIILVFFCGLFLVLWKTGFYKNLKAPMIYAFYPYIVSVSLHGTLSLALIFVIGLTTGLPLKFALIFFGSILFMISDYFISWHNFKDKESKAILRLNSGTYFTGLMLIALSFTYSM